MSTRFLLSNTTLDNKYADAYHIRFSIFYHTRGEYYASLSVPSNLFLHVYNYLNTVPNIHCFSRWARYDQSFYKLQLIIYHIFISYSFDFSENYNILIDINEYFIYLFFLNWNWKKTLSHLFLGVIFFWGSGYFYRYRGE